MLPPGIYGDIPENVYHADRTSLSSTGAKTLTQKTPAEFHWEQSHPVHKSVFDFGSLVHGLALGVGPEVVIVDADDWRTKDARAQRDAARDRGAIPALEKDYQKAERMIDVLRSHRIASELLSGGAAEQSIYWDDTETGVRLRGRIDYLHALCAVDYKTTADASPRGFAKSVANFHYHQQNAWYVDGLAALDHEVDDFLFIAQCVEPPFLVSVNRIDPRSVRLGHELNRQAINLFALCQMTGEWAGYDERINTIALPEWTYNEAEIA